MTSTWRVQHHAGADSIVNTDEVTAAVVYTDPDNNLVLDTPGEGVKAIYKRESWHSVVREEPTPVTVILVPVIVRVPWAPPTSFIERHAELII